VVKSYRKKKRKGKKSVEKCLYGERDIASKKPLLSPIPELPEVSEMTPLAHCVQRTCSDDLSVSGKLEEMISLEIPGKRQRPLPQEEESPELEPACDQPPVSALCCCLLPIPAASEGGPNANARDTGRHDRSRAERKRQSAKEPDTKTGSSPVPCASVTHGHIVSEHPKALCSPWCQEFSKADQNTDDPCETLSETRNIKCEEDSECRAPKGSLQCDPFPSDYSEREWGCSENVLVDHLKESTSHSENAGRKPEENSNLPSGRERKRKSVHCCEGQISYLEQNGNPAASCGGGSSAEISLGNLQLCADLSAALEQSFQRTSDIPKVRRSSRLQGDVENTGLVWMLPPTPPKSQKSKRRTTICAFYSREFGSMSSREETISSGQNPGAPDAPSAPPSIPGSESQGVGSSKLPGKRRKSFCVSTLINAESTTEPPCFKRRSSFNKGESSLLL
ncbi:hypothetical protein A6R68_12422, partial [Neotoma lepida]